MTSIQALREEINLKHQQLVHHPVFAAVHDLADLQLFMEWHVFAVWDFMSLVKRLQNELTVVTLPWHPPANVRAARLINEIVLGEESDETPHGPMSHFDLYLMAMREVGASTDAIDNFVALVRSGVPVANALAAVDAPLPVQRFVGKTMEVCLSRTRNEVIGNFFFGRENVIPDMFRTLIADWQVEPESVSTLMFYLERHIEVDSGDHGPAAEQMIAEITDGEESALADVLQAGLAAIAERQALWSGLMQEMEQSRVVSMSTGDSDGSR